MTRQDRPAAGRRAGPRGLAEPASAKRARCSAKASKTVAKNHLVRLFSVRNGEGGRTLYGCSRASGRKTTVAKGYDDMYVLSGAYRDTRLAGRFAAVAFDATDIGCKAACPPDYDPTTTTVAVVDVRARRRRTAVSTRRPARCGSRSGASPPGWPRCRPAPSCG